MDERGKEKDCGARIPKTHRTAPRAAESPGCGSVSLYLASKGLLRTSRILQFKRVSVETLIAVS